MGDANLVSLVFTSTLSLAHSRASTVIISLFAPFVSALSLVLADLEERYELLGDFQLYECQCERMVEQLGGVLSEWEIL